MLAFTWMNDGVACRFSSCAILISAKCRENPALVRECVAEPHIGNVAGCRVCACRHCVEGEEVQGQAGVGDLLSKVGA